MKAYRALIRAAKGGLLLGGVRVHHSTPFEVKTHAEDFADVIVQENRKAGREVSGVEILEVRAHERHVIKKGEVE